VRNRHQLLQQDLHEARTAPGESKVTIRDLRHRDDNHDNGVNHDNDVNPHTHYYLNHPPKLQRDPRKSHLQLWKWRTLSCLPMRWCVPRELRIGARTMREWSLLRQRRTGHLRHGPLP
jgi:hypothetical protein